MLWTDLAQQVFPEVRAPESIVVNALRNASRNFCEDTTFWRVDHAPITTVTDEVTPGSYDLTLPSQTHIVSVDNPVTHVTTPVHHRTYKWLNENISDWITKTGTIADWFTMQTPTRIHLVPYPIEEQIDALLVKLILKPSEDSTSLDDTIFDGWFEAITAGAKYLLTIMLNKEWTDKESAMIYRAVFESEVIKARNKITSGYVHQTADRRHSSRGHFF